MRKVIFILKGLINDVIIVAYSEACARIVTTKKRKDVVYLSKQF